MLTISLMHFIFNLADAILIIDLIIYFLIVKFSFDFEIMNAKLTKKWNQ